MPSPLHTIWKAYWKATRERWKAYDKALEEWERLMKTNLFYNEKMPSPPPEIPYPKELFGMTCGAKTRAGTPCKQKGLYNSGRCKLHGGLSTGPRTAKGKRKVRYNARKEQSP